VASRIRGITVQIGSDTTGLQAALSDVNKSAREIQSELRQVESLLRFNPHDTELLAQKQQLLADRVETTREKLDTLKIAQEQVNEQFRKGEISQEQHRAFQRELIKTESQLKTYEKQLRAANLQNHEFNQRMQEMGKKLQGVGKQLTDVGKTLSTRLTAPLTALGAVSAKTAMDFESAFAGVRKTVTGSEEEFAELEKGIRGMAGEIPAAATEVARVAEVAGQLGIANEHLLSFTRTMIDLGETTNMSADEAATALARLANITQMPQDQFDRLGSTVTLLGTNLATTESEIVQMGLRLAGAGAQVGMTEAEILSLAGALSSVGIEAQAGGSAISRLLADMQLAVETGSDVLLDFASVAGVSAEGFQKAFEDDAAGALVTFIQGLQTAEDRGMSAIKVLDDMGITEIRLRDALLRAAGAGDLFNESLRLGTRAWEENTALTDEASERYGTTAAQLQIVRNRLQDAAIGFGEILLPPLVTVAEKVGQFADWLGQLDPKIKTTVVVVGGLATALSPVLIILGQIVSSIGTLMPVLGTLAAFIMKTLIPAIMGISAPVVGTVAAIAALGIVAYEVYRNWTEVKDALINLWELLKASATQLGLNISLVFERMKGTVLSAVNAILERLSVLENLPFGLGERFAGLRDSISDSVDGSADKIAELQQSLSDNAVRMADAVDGTKVAFSDLGAAIADDVRSLVDNLTGQTTAAAAELDEQTDLVGDGLDQQVQTVTESQQEMTDTVVSEGASRVEATKESEEEQTETVSIEARKRAEARAEFEADWNKKLYQLTADRHAQLDAEEAEALARAEALEADKTAILEYYSIKRQELLDKEIDREREAEQRRLDALAKFEEDWSRKLFEATADRLELLEREKQEALAQAEELGAGKTAILEYYALQQQQILDEQDKARQESAEREAAALASFEETWTRKLFEQSADSLELLHRDRDEAIHSAEEIGADTTAILEYYAAEEKRILAELEAEREAVRERELKAEQDAQREREQLLRQWEARLFEQNASELDLLKARMQEELQLAEEHGLETTAILQYYENERQRILDRRRDEEEQAAEASARREAEAFEAREQARRDFEERWSGRLFELHADELERLEHEKNEAIRQAEEVGADTTALLEYYADKELEIRRRRAEEAQKIADEEAQAERERIENLDRARMEFEQSWDDRLFGLTASREELLLREREQALAKAEELGADVNKILKYYARRQAELADEIAEEQKGAWEKAFDDVKSPLDRFVDSIAEASGSIMSAAKAVQAGDWKGAFLSVLSETESFGKAMELIGSVMRPVVALFDSVLRPIVTGLLNLWNGIIDALASINLFGWRPFAGLKDRKVDVPGEGDGGGRTERDSRGGRQVSEITGPTRDLLTDLLTPLANLGTIVTPIQDIRDILDARMPDFNEMQFRGVGVMGVGSVVFEPGSIVIQSTATTGAAISSDLVDALEQELAGRLNFGDRGHGRQ